MGGEYNIYSIETTDRNTILSVQSVLYYTILSVQCTVSYNTERTMYCIIQYCKQFVLLYGIVLCYIVQYYTIQYNILLYTSVLQCTIQYTLHSRPPNHTIVTM